MGGILTGLITVLLVITTIALIGLILIQRGKGGGLAGAFGGGGVEQAFGTRATTLAQKATAVLGALYLILSIALGIRLGTSGRVSAPPAPASSQTSREGQPQAPVAPPVEPAPKETK